MTQQDFGMDIVAVPQGAGISDIQRAFTELAAHGWHVLAGLRQPGQQSGCVDAVLVGPGGVLVVETNTSRKRPSVLANLASAVVALVPAEARRHVQAVVCPPTEVSENDAIRVKPTVLAAFARSLPAVLNAESAAATASSLRTAFAGPGISQLWTVSKVLEWTKDSRVSEQSGNRASRRYSRRAHRMERLSRWLVRRVGLLTVAAVALALLVIFGR